MQFDNYITDLLYRYDCVILPEFGAFLSNRVSASIDQKTHTFYPPKKAISFNEQLKNNDGLLANYIASVEKIPYELAVKQISKKVRSLKSYLAQGETLMFHQLGDISLNREGNIRFEPSNDQNYLTESFGLAQFVSPGILREELKEKVVDLEKAAPVVFTPEKRRRPAYWKYAAVAVVALGIGGFLSSNYYLNQIEEQNQLAQEEAQDQLESQIQQATFIINNPLPAVHVNLEVQTGKYHVVAGAFRFEENSETKLSELRDLGYNARRIGTNKYGLHQVVYSSYQTRAEAQKALYQIRREHNKDAWLLIQELNR